jgi:hypothetical protein
MTFKQTTVPQIDSAALAAELAPQIAALIAHEVADKLKGVLALGDDAVLGEAAAASSLNKSAATMEGWRAKGFGPKWIRLGPRAIGYRVGDLRQYINGAARPSMPSVPPKPERNRRRAHRSEASNVP